ncbi:MAG: SH3 domain-containing protein [Desulfobacteraceae bacterium]|nr:SH3 domain-containing protein [Desulfobacteraceae bacterium]
MDRSMSVQVRQGHVRKTPTFLGIIVERLSYGDKVLILKDKGDWLDIKVEGTGTRGFMHISALTTKKIVFNPGDEEAKKTATSDEFALAGKGFNENVEDRFRADNPHLNFAGIDRMEGYGVSEKQMRQFLFKGQLIFKGENP